MPLRELRGFRDFFPRLEEDPQPNNPPPPRDIQHFDVPEQIQAFQRAINAQHLDLAGAQWAEPRAVRVMPERWEEVLYRVEKGEDMPKGKTGEDLFHLILSGIREIYEVDAVIAGGAVRDLAAGVTSHKDVDVFIPMTWEKFKKGIPELGWQLPPRPVVKAHDYAKIKAKPEVGCYFPTLARAQGRVQYIEVDLVFLEKPLSKENVATFPVFAQRGVWTLEGGLSLSPEAKADIEAKTFTIDPSITDKEKFKLVLEKVKGWCKREGYVDWKIVEPDIKEWWEAKEEIEEKEKTVVGLKEGWALYKEMIVKQNAGADWAVLNG
jgi:hypothetical protein